MSIFSKPFPDISAADLEELLADEAVENVRLEFKREVPSRDEMLKKVSSFANTYGGFIVIGADADSKDGRIRALPGVDPQKNFKQTVVQWCADGVSPLLDVDVADAIPLAANPGKVCYVVYTPESELAPHFMNRRKGIWVRTNEFSARFEAQLGNEHELEHLVGRRKKTRERRSALIDRARRRFETFIERRYAEVGKNKHGIGSHFTLCVVPRFPTRQLCTQASLRDTLRDVHLKWRNGNFPRTSLGFLSQHESEIILRPGSAFSLLEANCWGLLFYATEMRAEGETYQGIPLELFVGNLLVFLRHSREMVAKLGFRGQLDLEMQLIGILGEQWVLSVVPQVVLANHSSELDDEASFSFSSSSEDLLRRTDGVARDLLRFVFFATNWPEVAEDDSGLEKMIRKGYAFNMWDNAGDLEF